MAQKAHIATIQVILKPEAASSEAECADWMSGLLSEHKDVLDWQYLSVGGQILHPVPKYVGDDYKEGDGFY